MGFLGLVPAEVLALVAEPPGELVHHLLENNTVHVLAEHVEEEPVAHLALLDDGVDHLPLDEPEADVEKVSAHSRAQDDDGAIQDHQR